MESNLKFQSSKIEPLIIANCVKDRLFFLRIKKYLQTNDFNKKSYFTDNKYQNIFNIISKFFDKTSSFPKKETLEYIIDKTKFDDEIKQHYFSIINDMYQEKDIDEEFIEKETINFIKENRVYEAFLKSQLFLTQQEYSSILSTMEEALNVNFDKYLGLSIKEVDKVLDKLQTIEEQDCISSGYSQLDNILNGGFKGSSIYIFAALPGGNKCCRKDVKVKVKYKIDTETGEIV